MAQFVHDKRSIQFSPLKRASKSLAVGAFSLSNNDLEVVLELQCRFYQIGYTVRIYMLQSTVVSLLVAIVNCVSNFKTK